jgi:hypothetical protein
VGRRRTGGCFRRRDRHPDRRGTFVARRADPRRSCGGGGTGLDRSGADHLQLGARWAIGFVAVGGPGLFALGEPGSLGVGELWRSYPGGAAGPVRVLLPESVGTIVRGSKLLGAIVSVRVRVAVAVAEQIRIAVAVVEQVGVAVAIAIEQVGVAFAIAIALGVAFAIAFGFVLALAVVCFVLVSCFLFAVRGCLLAVCRCFFAVCGCLFTIRESQRVDGFGLS